MSLDVYLEGPEREYLCDCPTCGTSHTAKTSETFYSANITHNLTRMAREAGIYEHLWRPQEIGITTASQLIEPLTVGKELLKREPERFQAFNPPNGWGNYDGLVVFVEKYIAACIQYPDATVRVWA